MMPLQVPGLPGLRGVFAYSYARDALPIFEPIIELTIQTRQTRQIEASFPPAGYAGYRSLFSRSDVRIGSESFGYGLGMAVPSPACPAPLRIASAIPALPCHTAVVGQTAPHDAPRAFTGHVEGRVG